MLRAAFNGCLCAGMQPTKLWGSRWETYGDSPLVVGMTTVSGILYERLDTFGEVLSLKAEP